MVSNLKIERIKKGMTQSSLSLSSGIPQWRLSLIERGIHAKFDEKQKIATALGCQIDEIFPESVCDSAGAGGRENSRQDGAGYHDRG